MPRPTVASDRVIASQGAKPRYVATFHASCDPEVRARIEAKLRAIDDHPHRDRAPLPPSYYDQNLRRVTKAQMIAAQERVRVMLDRGGFKRPDGSWEPVTRFESEAVPESEECGCREDGGAHVPMDRDSRCAICDRVTVPDPVPAPEPKEDSSAILAMVRKIVPTEADAFDIMALISPPPATPTVSAPLRGAGRWTLKRAA